MAKARMLHKAISVSIQVSNLSLEAQLLFTWLIAHVDDDGKIKGEPKYIKGIVIPYFDWSIDNTAKYLQEIHQQGLIYYWEQDNQWYIEFPNWKNYQYIAKDRYHKSDLPSYQATPVDKMHADRIQEFDPPTTQSNIIQSNQVKSSGEDNIYSDIDSIKNDDIVDISQRFGVTIDFVEKSFNKLLGYCANTGKEYNDYKAALCKFVKTDIERQTKQSNETK